jgi:hypothetical protein
MVYKYEPVGLGYRELQRIGQFYSKTLNLWLPRLRSLGVIRDFPKIPIRLTDSARKKYEQGTLIIASDARSNKATKITKEQNKRKDTNKEEIKKRQNIYLLIVSIAVFGAAYYRRTSKPKLGQIVFANLSKNNKDNYYYYYTTRKCPGVGLIDIVSKRRTRSDYLPNRRKNIENAELFGYIDLTESEAEEHIKSLQNHNPPVLQVIEGKANNKPRYGVADLTLRDFIQYCIGTLADVDMRMEHVCKYRRLKKADKIEIIRWYSRLYGERRRMRELFGGFEYRQAELRRMERVDKKRKDDLIEHANRVIEQFDESIKQRYQTIMSEKFDYIRKKYRIVTEPLIEIVYPNFLQQSYEDDERKKKRQNNINNR